MRKYCQRNLEKKRDMYMIIIKIDCCGLPQTLCRLSVWMSSDAMRAKGLSQLSVTHRSAEMQISLDCVEIQGRDLA